MNNQASILFYSYLLGISWIQLARISRYYTEWALLVKRISAVFISRPSYLIPKLRFCVTCLTISLYIWISSFWKLSFVIYANMLTPTETFGLVCDIHASLCLVILNHSKVANVWGFLYLKCISVYQKELIVLLDFDTIKYYWEIFPFRFKMSFIFEFILWTFSFQLQFYRQRILQ